MHHRTLNCRDGLFRPGERPMIGQPFRCRFHYRGRWLRQSLLRLLLSCSAGGLYCVESWVQLKVDSEWSASQSGQQRQAARHLCQIYGVPSFGRGKYWLHVRAPTVEIVGMACWEP